jgi:hypothetical protein
VGVGPAHQADDDGVEVQGAVGKLVLIPVRIGAVADLLEHAVGDEPAEPVGQHVAGDPQVALHLAVATNAEERLAQDEERPAIGQHVHRELHRIARQLGGGVVSGGQLVRDLSWIVCATSFLAQP